ncbi:fimbrial chaperone protein [Sphingobium sp. B11D3B]|uniref:fimbrial biogenesis chaperone n=1 Tax=unclassified Sphingobium TaxID=2611147 RepID=UPI00222549AF|nr:MULTISPECIES: molecular chaperone [unclassified Sphingobium]MCW2365145.1 fimbrial chaperone protein [Sphingobium sp. B7D2B]MCW2389220.1 fimbrial chaperone protein [Sphingobium sp. B11D3B]
MIRTLSAFALAAVSLPAIAQQPSSVLLWPVNPVIEPDKQAAALWFENRGDAPVTLQVRVFAWAQQQGRNVYAAQDDVIGTPPIVTIAPGQRQLVRLTRTTPPPAQPEASYRVIVDEIPVVLSIGTQHVGQSLSFRMRYSLPLFSYASATKVLPVTETRSPETMPDLHWRVGQDDDGRFLEVTNRGDIHARLLDVAFVHGALPSSVSKGLLGYVLPRSTVRWPLDETIEVSDTLVASLNGRSPTQLALADD